jgi:NADPH:quinone reductase-like Zn-dependent oxidoreductase
MDFAAELGAHEVIDYKSSRFEDRVGNVDVVFDTVGGETLDRSWGVLNRGGRLVTIVSEDNAGADPRIQKAFFIVEPRREQLIQIATLIDSGELRTVVSATVPFWRAPDAYAGRVETNGRGKIVVILPGRT